MGQRKGFYSHIITELSCTRKESVKIDILVTSRNGGRRIMQSIRIMSRPSLENKEVERIQPVQMNIYQYNTYGKDLSWLYFNDDSRLKMTVRLKFEKNTSKPNPVESLRYMKCRPSQIACTVATAYATYTQTASHVH